MVCGIYFNMLINISLQIQMFFFLKVKMCPDKFTIVTKIEKVNFYFHK